MWFVKQSLFWIQYSTSIMKCMNISPSVYSRFSCILSLVNLVKDGKVKPNYCSKEEVIKFLLSYLQSQGWCFHSNSHKELFWMYLTELLQDMQPGVFIFIMCLMKEVGSRGEQLDNSDYKLLVVTWRPQQGLVVRTPCPSAHPFPCKRKTLSEGSQSERGRVQWHS